MEPLIDRETVMELNEISSNQLLSMLKKYLRETQNQKLKNLAYCGTQQIHAIGWQPATFVMSNGEKSKMMGIQTCHSSWSCPRCTPITMAKYGAEIACAIDALQTWHKQSAFMITFTMPHSIMMRAKTVFKILQIAWRDFARATKQKRNHGNADGKKRRSLIRGNDPFGEFREKLGIKHFVRVYEFTWGPRYGWHPHIHALFWVPNENWDKIGQYEQKLLDRWWHCTKRATIKVFNKELDPLNPDMEKMRETLENVEDYYREERKYTPGSRPLCFSKEKDGSIHKQHSSHYISGWSGDDELTAGYKTASEGHFTPYQLLEEAYRNPKVRKKYLQLFVEYAQATFGKYRIRFSKSEIKDIIQRWKLTQQYVETYKKKLLEKAGEKSYTLVCWFNAQQWSEILAFDSDPEITDSLIHNILVLAKKPNGKELIEFYLLDYGIDITQNPPYREQEFIENWTNTAIVA